VIVGVLRNCVEIVEIVVMSYFELVLDRYWNEIAQN
jgi:hypothetical protein